MRYILYILLLIPCILYGQTVYNTTFLLPISSGTLTCAGQTTQLINPEECYECDDVGGYFVISNPPTVYKYGQLFGMDFDYWLDSASCILGTNQYIRIMHFNDSVDPSIGRNPLAQISQNNCQSSSIITTMESASTYTWFDYYYPTDTTTYQDLRKYFFSTDFLDGYAGIKIFSMLTGTSGGTYPRRDGYDTVWIDCVKLKVWYRDTSWCHTISGVTIPDEVNQATNDSIVQIHVIRR